MQGTAAGCRDASCSTMQWNIPLPGADTDIPSYDQISLAVVAYNERGIKRETITFGWQPDSSGDPTYVAISTGKATGCALSTVLDSGDASYVSNPSTESSQDDCEARCTADPLCNAVKLTGSDCTRYTCPLRPYGLSSTPTLPYDYMSVTADAAYADESAVFKAISTNNVHVLDSATLNTWQEIPRGGFHGTNRTKAIWSIWYNHAIIPLWGAIGLASVVCGGFLMKYFAGHTESTHQVAVGNIVGNVQIGRAHV